MNTPFNQYNEVLDYFVIEGYQEGCISIDVIPFPGHS
jgi:hypothetical protein